MTRDVVAYSQDIYKSVGCQMGSRLTYACQEEHLCVRQMRSCFGEEEMWEW